MNSDWINFLKSNNTVNTESTGETITAISDLAIIAVSGNDVASFLQGQLTCNINDLNPHNSFFSAFCNAKGRTISTLLIVKHKANFLLILPLALIDKVMTKLKLYVLRANVQLNNASSKYCLIGLQSSNPVISSGYPSTDFEVSTPSEIIIKLPSNQPLYFILSDYYRAKQLWTQLTEKEQFFISDNDAWNFQSISAGLAWLDEKSSEQYIPQMLNIDKLGGINFQKGCYTGQEIIARTHYLGKAKRQLFLAECDKIALLNSSTAVTSTGSQTKLGNIIAVYKNDQNYRLLTVISTTGSELNSLTLDNPARNKITIIAFQ